MFAYIELIKLLDALYWRSQGNMMAEMGLELREGMWAAETCKS